MISHVPNRTTRLTRRLLLICCLITGGIGAAQTPQHSQPATKRYCEAGGSYCFRYPSSWTEVGAEYPGNGIVIAPPQKQERAQWDTITVVQMVLVNDDAHNQPLSFYIDRATTGAREAGQDFQTLERQSGVVNGHATESLTARYRENGSGREWIEKLVFIEADDETYSIVLKCAPENLARLETTQRAILHSFSVQPPETSAEPPKPSGAVASPPHPDKPQ